MDRQPKLTSLEAFAMSEKAGGGALMTGATLSNEAMMEDGWSEDARRRRLRVVVVLLKKSCFGWKNNAG